MCDKMNAKNYLLIIITAILLADLTIILDIPFLRQILGFLFLAFLPGLLILQILKLNKIGFLEKFVLSWGLSISFLMFFGLLINNSLLGIGYKSPLSTISLLISFNIAFVVLAIIGYRINKDQIFSLPTLNLSTSEKAFLIAPVMFPALSILGMHVMNTTDNNIILMFLLFLIPIYIVFVCFFNQKFSKRLYPVVIFLISISVLLLYMLRFPHIFGHDVHSEYYFFQITLDNLHWSVVEHSALDACLSISILPTIFQSILNIDAREYFFKSIYISICSFLPLAIYIISKRYIDELYAFLASFFFISQIVFLTTAENPRTNVAVFFVALAVMVFFNDKINPLQRRILFIVFILSVVVSHYSTTYIFFVIILFSWLVIEIFSRRSVFKSSITLTIVLLFFALIFFWYSQVTVTSFNAGIDFVEETLSNLNTFFIEESRSGKFKMLVGKELAYPVLSKINLAFTWGTFVLIGIGVLTMIARYKEMVALSNVKHKKPDFLKDKFEMEYLVMTLACAGLMVSMVALPYISKGYGIERLYSLMLVILSVCFVIGGIVLSKYFKLKPYLIILLILVPYFLFWTGPMYQIFGAHVSVNLNSGGKGYDREYIHDSESCAAKWLMMNGEKNSMIYPTDVYGRQGLISQGKISSNRIDEDALSAHKKLKGYIYLCYNNVVNGKLVVEGKSCNMSEYPDSFIGKSKVYSSGCSEIYG